MNRRMASRSRGFATLLIAGLLGLLSTLALLGWAAGTLAEQRAAANEARSVEVRAAAEAGVAWALARLNEPHGHGPECQASASADSLWHRRFDDGTPGVVRVRAALASATPSSWACVREGSSWRCNCPADGASAWSAGWLGAARSAAERRAAFVVSVQQTVDGAGRPVARLLSTGCVDTEAACVPARPDAPAATPVSGTTSISTVAQVRIDLATAPLLQAVPAAAWTALGNLSVDAASVAVNRDAASGGRVLWSGAAVGAGGASIVGQNGAPWPDRVSENDPWLAALGASGLDTALLGLPVADWAGLGRVSRVDCRVAAGDCAQQVAAALGSGASALWVQGDLWLTSGAGLAAAANGVVLVVDGELRISGPLQLNGLVLAQRLTVDAQTGPVVWRGAAVSRSTLQVLGAAHIERDAALLGSLAGRAATVVPAIASWREF